MSQSFPRIANAAALNKSWLQKSTIRRHCPGIQMWPLNTSSQSLHIRSNSMQIPNHSTACIGGGLVFWDPTQLSVPVSARRAGGLELGAKVRGWLAESGRRGSKAGRRAAKARSARDRGRRQRQRHQLQVCIRLRLLFRAVPPLNYCSFTGHTPRGPILPQHVPQKFRGNLHCDVQTFFPGKHQLVPFQTFQANNSYPECLTPLTRRPVNSK